MSAEKGSPQNTLPFYPLAPLRGSRDLIFNPPSSFKFTSRGFSKSGSSHFRSNLLSWLSVFWSQPYFAWHPLIREQERPCAQGAPRESKSWALIPAPRPGIWHVSVPAHKMNQGSCCPFLFPSHTIQKYQTLSYQAKLLPWCSQRCCPMESPRCSLGSWDTSRGGMAAALLAVL